MLEVAGESREQLQQPEEVIAPGPRPQPQVVSERRVLAVNAATLIEYETPSGLLWWDKMPIGRLVDAGPETVEENVARLHAAFQAAAAAFRDRLQAEYFTDPDPVRELQATLTRLNRFLELAERNPTVRRFLGL